MWVGTRVGCSCIRCLYVIDFMVRPDRVGLPTFWFVAMNARRISHLAIGTTVAPSSQSLLVSNGFGRPETAALASANNASTWGWARYWAQWKTIGRSASADAGGRVAGGPGVAPRGRPGGQRAWIPRRRYGRSDAAYIFRYAPPAQPAYGLRQVTTLPRQETLLAVMPPIQT